jgi:hypothetical protein
MKSMRPKMFFARLHRFSGSALGAAQKDSSGQMESADGWNKAKKSDSEK